MQELNTRSVSDTSFLTTNESNFASAQHNFRFVPTVGKLLALAILANAASYGAALTPGNLIVTVNEFTGSSSAPKYIAEYTPSGTRVQILAQIPWAGGEVGASARDLLVGPDNAIYLFNGTFTNYLARFNVASSNWTSQTFAGWSTLNNTTYGGICQRDQYIFAGDMVTAGNGSPSGIVRFDLLGGPTVRFPLAISPMDIYMSPDGVLYALDGASSPINTVYRFDSTTLAPLGTTSVAFSGHRAVAVAGDGSIFLADDSGLIRRYSQGGALLDSLNVTNVFFSDMNINSRGKIALATAQGEVVVTDMSLDTSLRFYAVTNSSKLGGVFVAWVPQPIQAATLKTEANGNFANLEITGTVNATYSVQYSTSLPSTAWTVLTNVTLSVSPMQIPNFDSLSSTQRFYRAVGLP